MQPGRRRSAQAAAWLAAGIGADIVAVTLGGSWLALAIAGAALGLAAARQLGAGNAASPSITSPSIRNGRRRR